MLTISLQWKISKAEHTMLRWYTGDPKPAWFITAFPKYKKSALLQVSEARYTLMQVNRVLSYKGE